MKGRPVVAVTRRLPDEVEAELAAEFDVRLNRDDRQLDEAELREALTTADAVLCTVTDPFTRSVLAAEPLRARILANFGVGYNHIDLAAAAERGIAVTNTPGVLTDATADLTMTLLLMAARRAGEGERQLRAGAWTGWRPTHLMGTSVAGKTLGIVGFGRIGRAVAHRASRGFGMRVVYTTPNPPPASEEARTGASACATLAALLEQSDFVSLHCPATPATRHLIDAEALASMRTDAFLINTARGDVVDEAALVEALRLGVIAGAGLDVYEDEPRVSPALLEMENVVLLPHLGSATREARVAMGMRALTNLRAWFRGEALPDRLG